MNTGFEPEAQGGASLCRGSGCWIEANSQVWLKPLRVHGAKNLGATFFLGFQWRPFRYFSSYLLWEYEDMYFTALWNYEALDSSPQNLYWVYKDNLTIRSLFIIFSITQCQTICSGADCNNQQVPGSTMWENIRQSLKFIDMFIFFTFFFFGGGGEWEWAMMYKINWHITGNLLTKTEIKSKIFSFFCHLFHSKEPSLNSLFENSMGKMLGGYIPTLTFLYWK